MFKKHIKNQKGLTLIELLAVIVILGIIAAIAVPAIGNVIDKTEEKAAYTEAQQIIDSARLYITAETPTFGNDNKLTLNNTDTDFQAYYDKAGTFTLVVTNTDGNLTYEFTAFGGIDGVTADAPLTESAIASKLE
nr:prepilin-type N-terminal cleavage/methylation domain-containing protein [Fredinandcohnia onubensis]